MGNEHVTNLWWDSVKMGPKPGPQVTTDIEEAVIRLWHHQEHSTVTCAGLS